jgi:hypothetical protein
MYGHPFLLENLPPTDSAPLADYLPYLNLLRELLREHVDQILPHPITISVKPGDLVILNGSSMLSIGTSVDESSSGHSHDTHCCQAQWDPPMVAPLKEQLKTMEKEIGGLLKLSREQHFTVVLLANAHLNAYVSCCPILKLPPLYHTTCLLLLIKNLTSCTFRDINLSKAIQRTAMRAPSGCRSLRILPHTILPARRKQLRDQCFTPIPDPQPLTS